MTNNLFPVKNVSIVCLCAILAASIFGAFVTQAQASQATLSALGAPGWVQTNTSGFGDINNKEIARMSIHNGLLYTSTANDVTGGEVYRSTNGENWVRVAQGGFGNPENIRIQVSQSIQGFLYFGTENLATGGELWRCAVCDDSDWDKVVSGSLLGVDHTNVQTIRALGTALYATVDGSNGVAVLKSPSGASGTWTKINANGFGNAGTTSSWAAAVLNSYYYVGTSPSDIWTDNPSIGGEIWRCSNCDGTDWEQVNANGFGDVRNGIWDLEAIGDMLYLVTANRSTGPEVWRCSTCDGSDWTQINQNGFGSPVNMAGQILSFHGTLYSFTTSNDGSPSVMYTYENGTLWNRISLRGWGDNNTMADVYAVLNDHLHIGTKNTADGAQIWMMLDESIYIPMSTR